MNRFTIDEYLEIEIAIRMAILEHITNSLWRNDNEFVADYHDEKAAILQSALKKFKFGKNRQKKDSL